MQDILEIQDIILERAKSALLRLQGERNRLLAEINKMEEEITVLYSNQNEPMDLVVLECWRKNRYRLIEMLAIKVTELEAPIGRAISRYKSALAKGLTLENIVRQQAQRHQLQVEEKQADIQLSLELVEKEEPAF